MSRASLIVCIALLIHGAAAKPYKPWSKLVNVAIQDTNMKDKGEVDWGLQVEPIEDLDPSMKIWKSVVEAGPNGKYQRAEEDLDELQHPSLMEVPGPGEAELHYEDVEEVRRLLAPLIGNIGGSPLKPEDIDDLYRADPPYAAQVEALAPAGSDIVEQMAVRLHLEPEEDMDNLYHGDQLQVPASELAGLPSSDQEMEVRHNEPEEDMDDLYHQ